MIQHVLLKVRNMVIKLKGQKYKQVLDRFPMEILFKWCGRSIGLNSGVSVLWIGFSYPGLIYNIFE